MIFVAVTLTAVVIYWLVARPTVLADRFVAAVSQGDYKTAKSLLSDKRFWAFHRNPGNHIAVDRIYAEVLPRDWSDIHACRRRVIFLVAYHEDTLGRHIEWAETSDVIAGINGLKPENFHRSSIGSEFDEQRVDRLEPTLPP